MARAQSGQDANGKPPPRPPTRFEGVITLLWLAAFVAGIATGIATAWAVSNYGDDEPAGWVALVSGIGAGFVAAAPFAGLAAVVRLLQSIDERVRSAATRE